MPDMEISVLTREYLAEPVSASDPNQDLTQLDVWMAVMPDGQSPSDSDWVGADWHHDAATGVDTARALLGADLPLQRGVLNAWIKLDTGVELVIRVIARLLVF